MKGLLKKLLGSRARRSVAIAVAASGAGLLAWGCSLPLFDVGNPARNVCTSNSECGPGVCKAIPSDGIAFTGESSCVATSSDLGSLVIEVRPTADANGNTVSHVFTNALTLSGDYPKGAIEPIDLLVPQKVTFSGEVIGEAVDAVCTGADASTPARVELHSISAYAGLGQTYTTNAALDIDGKYRFSIEVPAGHYDVYLKPAAPTAHPECTAHLLPPRFVPDVDVSTSVDFTTSPKDQIAHLSGTLVVPQDRSVAGWHLEVVDDKYGLVLSDSMELADPPAGSTSIQILGGGGSDDTAGLRYYYTGSPIIRLRDASGTLVVHWVASAVDLDKDGKVDLDVADLVANPIPLEATVVDADTRGVPAAVTIESDSLSGSAKQNASFRVTTETNADGVLDVNLVPGVYTVAVSSKNDLSLASVTDKWEVKAGTLGHGKAFVLPERPLVQGAVLSPKGDPLPSVPVVFAASKPDAQSYFGQTVSAATPLPRESTITTDDSGDFKLGVDPGTVDLSVQPPAETLYPWLLVPRLLVDTSAKKPVLDVNDLTISPPVIVQGLVHTSTTFVPHAVVRVLLPLPLTSTDQGMPAPVVEIGEAVTDDAGKFTIPLPSSLTRLP